MIRNSPVPPPQSSARSGEFNRLDLLACSVGYGCGVGMVPVLMGYLIKSMQLELELPTSILSFGSIVVFFSALIGPITGGLIGRIGITPCLIIGHASLSAGLALIAVAPPGMSWLVLAGILVLISAPLCYTVAYAALVSLLFSTRQGFAFGVTFSGTSFISMIGAPPLIWATERFDWRVGAGIMALIAVVGGVLALMRLVGAVRRRSLETLYAKPHAKGDRPVAMPEALKSPVFWFLAIALATSLIPLGGFIAQLQPLLSHLGFPSEMRLLIGVIYAAAIALGRVVGGLLIDWFAGSVLVPGAVFTAAAFGACLLGVASPQADIWLPVLAVVLLGAASGAEADFAAYYCLRAFGHEGYAATIGAIILLSGVAFAMGGYLFALGYDLLGTYRPSAFIASFLFLVAAALFVLIRSVLSQDILRSAQS